MTPRLRLALLLATALPGLLHADTIVVYSEERGPVVESILSGAKKFLPQPFVEASDAAALKKAVDAGAKAVLVIGASSADRVRTTTSIPMVVTGVPNIYDKKWEHAVKVHLDAPDDIQLKWLKEVAPKALRIAVVYHPDKSPLLFAEANKAIQQGGLQLVPVPSKGDLQELGQTLQTLKGSVDVFWILMDPVAAGGTSYGLISQFCLSEKLILMAPAEPHVQLGATLAIVASYEDVGETAAQTIQAQLASKSKEHVFVKTPQLFLNRANMQHLKLSLPESLIQKAKKVY